MKKILLTNDLNKYVDERLIDVEGKQYSVTLISKPERLLPRYVYVFNIGEVDAKNCVEYGKFLYDVCASSVDCLVIVDKSKYIQIRRSGYSKLDKLQDFEKRLD